MLRTGLSFLILPVACSILFPAVQQPRCFAQTEEDAAPWRIEASGQVDLDPEVRLDLNTAAFDDLLQIPGMTPDLARAIVQFREAFGPFQNVEDLELVAGINDDIIEQLSHLSKELHEEGGYSFSYIVRCQENEPFIYEAEGESYRHGEKFTIMDGRGVALGLAFEKDPGEDRILDHSAFSLEVPLFDEKGKIVLGDYLVGFGQGLVIRTRRNFGLSRNPDSNLRFYPRALRAYRSWDESIALRGGGVILDLRRVSVCAWGSQRHRDAYLNSAGQITSFDQSGLHRTETEEERRDACLEEAWGAHLELKELVWGLNLGATVSSVGWDRPLLIDENPLCETRAGSFDLNYSADHVRAEIEAAWDYQGNAAQMAVMHLQSDLLRNDVALYRADPNYFSPLASSLDFDLGEVHNREGVYSHLRMNISPGSLSGFAHLYRFPRRLPGQSWGGQDFYLGGRMDLGAGMGSSLSSRWVQEEEPGTHQKMSRWRGYGSFQAVASNDWRLKFRLQLCRLQASTGLGRMISLKVNKKWTFRPNYFADTEIGSGIYHADDYSLRLYWVEYDASRSLRVRPLWDKGGILQLSAGLSHRRWGRLGFILLWDQPETESLRSPSRTITGLYKYP